MDIIQVTNNTLSHLDQYNMRIAGKNLFLSRHKGKPANTIAPVACVRKARPMSTMTKSNPVVDAIRTNNKASIFKMMTIASLDYIQIDMLKDGVSSLNLTLDLCEDASIHYSPDNKHITFCDYVPATNVNQSRYNNICNSKGAEFVSATHAGHYFALVGANMHEISTVALLPRPTNSVESCPFLLTNLHADIQINLTPSDGMYYFEVEMPVAYLVDEIARA